MATFSPFGLQGDLSTSAASQANPTLLTFPWDPTMSGWSGDLAIAYLPDSNGEAINSTLGYVYPGFATTNISPPSGTAGVFYPPIVGVITGFRYKPANNSLTPNDTWPSYEADTVLQTGTTVQVIVNTDAQARYKIQYYGEESPSLLGLTKDYLFGSAFIGGAAEDLYQVTLGGVIYTFVRGTPNTATASAQGLEPGTSRMALVTPSTISQNLTTAQVTRRATAPLLIMTPNNYDNSGWWSANDPDDANVNNILGVMLNQTFINSNTTPIFEQTVTYS